MLFDRTIDAAIPDWPPLTPADRDAAAERAAEFLRAQLRRAPLHIRVGFGGLFVAFAIFALFSGAAAGGPRLSQALTSFSRLRLPMVGGLERVIRSATLLSFFEEPSVLALIGETTPAERQEEYRARRRAIVEA